ncbi:MAG: hypothetical protein ACM30I_13750 [Gemmatimonas sp.]
MAFLDPVGLLVFFGAIALAYGIGRAIRIVRDRRRRARAPEPPLSRAERRRRGRGRR